MACAYLGRLTGRPQPDLARHGRHDREGGDRRGRPAGADERVRGRRRHQPLQQARQGRRPSDQAPVHRRLRDRRRRRQHRRRSTRSARSAVGPLSAGSVPGPGLLRHRRRRADADRRAARRSATSTRAQLGGGAITLDPARAHEALDRVVAAPLGRSVEEAAHGILMLAVATMTRAVKAVTTYRGRDPRDFTLCAFGGNGPLDRRRDRPRARDRAGARPARARRLQRPRPALLRHRARGRAHADAPRRRDHGRTRSRPRSRSSRREATAQSRRRRRRRDRRAATRTSATRARPTSSPCRCRPGPVDVERLVADFVAEHVRTYGHGSPTTRSTSSRSARSPASSATAGAAYDPLAAIRALPATRASRLAYFGPEVGLVETPVCNRAGLLGGERRGPAPRRRGRLDLRRPAGLPGPARRATATSRSSSMSDDAPSTRSRSR